MTIKPLRDRVVIERIEAESKTAGGIIIPDNAKEKPSEGIVIAVGSGIHDSNGKLIPLDVQVGDLILFAKWGGVEVKFGGKELIILKESDILAIISKK
jgi:chaperonin GroES